MERFYPRTNNTSNLNGGYENDNFFNGYDSYPEDYQNYNNSVTLGQNDQSNTNENSCIISNTASAKGYFYHSGSSQPSYVSGEDTVTLSCVMADLEKTADKSVVSPGDTIKYTITFRNMSSVNMYNVKLTDQLPENIDVIATSINPFPQNNESLSGGINVGTVPPGASKTLTFSATVSQDATEDIVNRAFADFNFYDENGAEQSASTPITSVTTTLENAGITVEKTANKNYVTAKGEEIEFTITVTNNSAYGISDLVVTDNLPKNLAYVAGSTIINDAKAIDANPSGGIYIGELDSGKTAVVKFSVTVNI